MPNSQRHNQLLSRIRQLENNLLPQVKINGNYTIKESDLIRSYVLLCHAEIESFLEDIATNKVQKALSDWRSSRKKSNCLLSVMAFCAEEINWDNIQNNSKENIDFRLNKVINHYLSKLQSNHGIKSENIRNMLLPIGIESNQLDQTWLNIMDTFGSKRGEFAHKSLTVQSQIDLITEKNNINNSVLPEIKNIDLMIKNII